MEEYCMSKESHFGQTEIGLLPDDWNLIALKDVCSKIGSGVTPRGGDKVYKEKGTALVRSQNVLNNRFVSDGLVYIDEDIAKEMNNVEVVKQDILLNITGDSVARCCTVPNYALPARVNQHVSIIRTNKEHLDPIFLTYYLTSPKMQSHMLSLAQSGGTRNALTKGMIENFVVPCPDIKEQKAIARILLNFDSKITLNEHINQTLRTAGQAIFKRWFVDFEFPNEEGKPYKSSGGEMIYSGKLGKEVPKGWMVGAIDDLCSSITNGGTPKRMVSKYWNGSIPWFKTGELTDSPLIDSEEHITEEGLEDSACKLWEENTVLIALYAAPTVGRLGLLRIKAASNQACSGLVAKKEISYPFLFYTLFFKRNEFNNIAVGAAQQNISQQIVREAKTTIPPTALLKSFNDTSSTFFHKQTELVLQNRTLTQIRDTLLPKLMSGKIRVPVSKDDLEKP